MVKYKIKDLKEGMKNVDIEVTIDFLGEKRSTSGYNNDSFVAGFVTDETGEIKVTFWNEDVKKAKPGKKFRIEKGYVTAFKGAIQLNASKEKGIVWL